MTSVAFFRNLNQGQRGHPSTAQIVEAFQSSGAVDVRPVRSNGTVVFEVADSERCLAQTLDHLEARCGWEGVAFSRDGDWLADRVAEFPAGVAPALVELSLFSARHELTSPLPMRGKGCSVVAAGHGYAITVNESPGTSQATPTLERALATPVTSRTASTVHLVLESL